MVRPYCHSTHRNAVKEPEVQFCARTGSTPSGYSCEKWVRGGNFWLWQHNAKCFVLRNKNYGVRVTGMSVISWQVARWQRVAGEVHVAQQVSDPLCAP